MEHVLYHLIHSIMAHLDKNNILINSQHVLYHSIMAHLDKNNIVINSQHVLYHSIMAHLDKNNILINSQHGFHAKHSCESQLLSTVGSLARSLNNHKQTNVLILGFSKVFDPVPHQRLRLKLKHWHPGKDMALDQFLAYKQDTVGCS